MNKQKEITKRQAEADQEKKELSQEELKDYENKITNSRNHLKHDWDNLKELLKSQPIEFQTRVRELVYNIEKEARYLGTTIVKQERYQELINWYF